MRAPLLYDAAGRPLRRSAGFLGSVRCVHDGDSGDGGDAVSGLELPAEQQPEHDNAAERTEEGNDALEP